MLTQALHRAPTEEEIKKERSRCKKVFGTRAKALHRPRTEEELAVSKGKTIAKKKLCAECTKVFAEVNFADYEGPQCE